MNCLKRGVSDDPDETHQAKRFKHRESSAVSAHFNGEESIKEAFVVFVKHYAATTVDFWFMYTGVCPALFVCRSTKNLLRSSEFTTLFVKNYFRCESRVFFEKQVKKYIDPFSSNIKQEIIDNHNTRRNLITHYFKKTNDTTTQPGTMDLTNDLYDMFRYAQKICASAFDKSRLLPVPLFFRDDDFLRGKQAKTSNAFHFVFFSDHH